MTNETSMIHHPTWIHEMNGKREREREKKNEMKSKTNTNENEAKRGGKEQENQAIQVKNLVHM